MAAREALIVASAQYSDPVLRQLKAPEADANSLSEVLSDPNIGGFQTRTLIDRPSYEVAAAIEEFFVDRQSDDLLLLYFSGHGIKDADGRLFFATVNTRRNLLLATSVPASMVNEAMLRSRSRSQVLILDCCHSGAFARGMVAKSDDSVGTIDHFRGTGRIILTASDAAQYALEAEQVTGSGTRSIFTQVLVDGLKTGAADTNFDGLISLDELFDYTEGCVLQRTPIQKPMKWVLGATGSMVIAHNRNPVTQPAELPKQLLHALDKDVIPAFRQVAAKELGKLLGSSNRALALAAELKLNELLEDDSRTIQDIARGHLTARASAEGLECERQSEIDNDRIAGEEGRRHAVTAKAHQEKEEQEQPAGVPRPEMESQPKDATGRPQVDELRATPAGVTEAAKAELIEDHFQADVRMGATAESDSQSREQAEREPLASWLVTEDESASSPSTTRRIWDRVKASKSMGVVVAAVLLIAVCAWIYSCRPPTRKKLDLPQKVNVSAGVAEGFLLQRTAPEYPQIAKAARVSGTVVLQATISKGGTIEDLRVIGGPAMLQQAAMDAVRQWRYKPYLLYNEPVEVETTVTVAFTLGG